MLMQFFLGGGEGGGGEGANKGHYEKFGSGEYRTWAITDTFRLQFSSLFLSG